MPKKETKILYLLGAGASAKVLPLAKPISDGTNYYLGLSDRMKILAEELEKGINPLQLHSPNKFYKNDCFKTRQDNKETANVIIDYLKIFAEKAETYGTIDTLAKYYFTIQSDEYSYLKSIISFYFTVEQLAMSYQIDPRYLTFLTSILEKGSFLPENVKILSWNYDFQMEMTAHHFFRPEKINHSKGVQHRQPPVLDYFPRPGISRSSSLAQIAHLNGIAGFYNVINNDVRFIDNFFLKESVSIDDLYNFMSANQIDSLIEFAWDKNHGTDWEPYQMASDTTHLVVIGYSFPFFNREIDRNIMDIISSSGKLEKIYFQDPYIDGQFLINQFDLDIKSEQIKHIEKCDNFFIPHEL